MLGDLLNSLTDETTALETVLGTGDLALLTAVRERAAKEGIDLATYVSQTVQRYAHEASDDEWTTLMGALNRSQDPAATCLKRAFEHDLRG
jgi:hypothetical protein